MASLDLYQRLITDSASPWKRYPWEMSSDTARPDTVKASQPR